MLCRLLVIATFAMITSVVGSAEAAPANVRVVNGRGAPAPVMDQTVLRPVHGNMAVRLEAGQSSAFLELFTPPAGQMVVIEYLTIQAFVEQPTANAFLELEGGLGEGGGIEHALEAFPPPISLNVVSTYQQMLTQHVLLYSTDTVVLSIDRGLNAAGAAEFYVSFSGYLVKAPN